MEILKLLNNLNIKYELVNHKKVYTVEEAEFVKNLIEGTGTKNLFLKDNKKNYYLYVLEETKKADLKKLKEILNVKNLSFANEEELYNILSLEKGSVTPLGIINDNNNLVTILLDKSLTNKKLLAHPNINSATISLEYNDLIKFITHLNHKYLIID